MRDSLKLGDVVRVLDSRKILKQNGIIFDFGIVNRVGKFVASISVPSCFKINKGKYTKHTAPSRECCIDLPLAELEVINDEE